MVIRPATVADRVAVVALSLRFHGSTPYARLLAADPERIGALFDVALAQGVVYVAEVRGSAGELAAFLAVVALEHTLSGDRYAEEIAWWVEPAYRTGLLGPRLLRQVEGWAAAHGCAFLKMAAPSGTDVGTFYERQGYVPIETAYLKRFTRAQEVA